MWLERFLIVVPSLGHKYLPYSWGYYRPRPTEILITAATFAAMMLLYTLFAKFVPIISIWEMKAGEHQPPELDTPRRSAEHAPRRDARMKAVYALYSDGHGAQRAVNGLRAAGVPDSEITVITGDADGGLRVQPHRTARTRCGTSRAPAGWSDSSRSTWLTRFTERTGR